MASPLFDYARWRRLLFRVDPETAHGLAIASLRVAQWGPARKLLGGGAQRFEGRLGQDLLGCRFPAPVGLAAGFDKNGVVVRGMAALGFGSVEVGTVTPRPQPGNPRPRLWRHSDAHSLRNAMGFNNAGARALAARLERGYPYAVPLGVNVGRNKTTPPERSEEDYLSLVERFSRLCDYLVINVSSPNTPGLRDLQTPERVADLVRKASLRTHRPLLIKLAPDLDPGAAIELGEAAAEGGAAGLILTNTTIDYSLLPGSGPPGGLSGEVLREPSYALLRAVARRLFPRLLLVSAGGIDGSDEAYRRIRAGASLVQLYTALVYQGPGLIDAIHRGLVERLDRDGLTRLGEAVGTDL